MLPYKKYDFQIAKSLYENTETCVNEWLKPTLGNNISVSVMPIVKGKKALILKSDKSVTAFVDSKDITKYLSAIIDDLEVIDADFILEGYLTTDLNSDFEFEDTSADELIFKVYDVLHIDGTDLTFTPFDDRFEIAKSKFQNLNHIELAECATISNESDLEILKINNIDLILKSNQSLYTEGFKTKQWCEIRVQEQPIQKALLTYAIRKSKSGDKELLVTKSLEEEQFILAEVLAPEDVDLHKDIYSDEEVKFACHYYLANFGNIGKMHTSIINDQAKLVENYLAPVDFEIEASDGTIRQIKKGTWLQGIKITDDDLWKSIKDGTYTGLSIGGVATVEMLKSLRKGVKHDK